MYIDMLSDRLTLALLTFITPCSYFVLCSDLYLSN